MSEYSVHVNSAGKKASRIVHLEVLKAVSDIVMQTAGPKGSTTMITKNDGTYPIFTKDGKKTAEHIDVYGEVERGILDQLLQIVQEIVKRVGDGTTSAIRLAYLIFKGLMEVEDDDKLDMNTYDIIHYFQTATNAIIKEIRKHARELTTADVYDICMISTNGNEYLSDKIRDIYEEYGKEVYIEVKSSPTPDYMIKAYDGLTINKGYASPAYINAAGEICNIRDARIYVFKDPIDTPEMIGFFTRIIYDNILTPYSNLNNINMIKNNPAKYRGMTEEQLNEIEQNSTMIPTVIMCPFISRDVSTLLQNLESLLHGFDRDDTTRAAKPPVAIVTNLTAETDELADIAMLCGCKIIGKYIDATVQQKDIEDGVAPTVDTVTDFYGTTEEVIIDKEKTKFINPGNMFEKDENDEFVLDENGNRVYSTTYESLVSFLKTNLKEAQTDGSSLVGINRLRRRLTGLTSCMVELYIGGISVTDRESVKDLADDAVRNCRSAAIAGVGRAANFEALLAANDVIVSEKTEIFVDIIKKAYTEIIKHLYSTCVPADMVDIEFEKSLDTGTPLNLRTLTRDHKVLTSIESDIAILDCISRVLTIMFTTNQILISSAFQNTYAAITESDNVK